MAPSKLTPAQVRDRRAKRAAVVLVAVLAVALVIQGPKLLKMIHKSSPPVSASTVNVAPVSGASSTSTPASTDMVAAPASTTTPGQLQGLSRFALKDPFYAQNVTTTTATTPSTPAATTTSSTTPSTSTPAPATTTPKLPTVSGILPTTKTTPAKTTPASTQPAVSVPFTVTTPAVPPNAAVLLANGKQEVIPVGQDFPTEAPLFKLNALGKQKQSPSIRISVVGGLFTNGVKTVGLDRGKTIMFKNESDGTRYVIKLLRLTNVASTGTSGGSTPAAATTTAAGTTPAPASPAPASTPTTAAQPSAKGA